MVFEKNAPLFVRAQEITQREGKYLYIILIKNDPGERIGDGVSGKASGGNTWKSDVRITRGGKAMRWCINTPSMKKPKPSNTKCKGGWR